ncbi:MAG: DJ-1/PfpI family protein [Myxococcales bacterium]|nr:DJ-1/PfpI family protein [Myxococcales bacterium]HRC55314.1 DJ-1/PfpI family protein [Kofleriaceae bacterium]
MEILVFVFHGITALDAIGPYEVLARMPGARLRFVAPEPGPILTDNQLVSWNVELGIDDARGADLLLVPGGFGTRTLEHDLAVLEWLRDLDLTTRITASVCTGALLLAAAGLLRDRQATTHWAQRERLREHGALPVAKRWVRDGKYATAAGVSAGIDLALALAHELCGRDVAEEIQLAIEYDPEPPLDAGSPERARPEIRDAVLQRVRRRDAALAAAAGHEP